MIATVKIHNQTVFPLKIYKGSLAPQNYCNTLESCASYYEPTVAGDTFWITLAINSQHVVKKVVIDQHYSPIIIEKVTSAEAADATKEFTAIINWAYPEREMMVYRIEPDGNDKVIYTNTVGKYLALQTHSIYKACPVGHSELPLYYFLTKGMQDHNADGDPPSVTYSQFRTFTAGFKESSSNSYVLLPNCPFEDRIHHGSFQLREGEVIVFDQDNFSGNFWFFQTPCKDVELVTGTTICSYILGPNTIIDYEDDQGNPHRSNTPMKTDGMTKFTISKQIPDNVAGVKVFNSWSEDALTEDGASFSKKTVLRTTFVITHPRIQDLYLSTGEDRTEVIIVNQNGYAPKTLNTASLGKYGLKVALSSTKRVTVLQTIDSLRGRFMLPELFIWHEKMGENDLVVVCPDMDLHQRMGKMELKDALGNKTTLYQQREHLGISKKVVKGLKQDTFDHVQGTLQSLGKAMNHAVRQDALATHTKRVIEGATMTHQYLILSFDEKKNTTQNTDQQSVLQHFKQHLSHAKSAPPIPRHVVSEDADHWTDHVMEHVDKVTDKVKGIFGVEDKVESIGSWWDDAWKDMKSLAIKVVDSVEHLVDKAVHVLLETEAGFFHFVCDEAEKLGKMIVGLIKAIGAELEKIIELLKFLFDWKNYKNSAKAIEVSITDRQQGLVHYFEQSRYANELKDMWDHTGKVWWRKNVTNKLEPIKTEIINKLGIRQPTSTPSSPTHNEVLEKLEWIVNAVTSHHSPFQPASHQHSTSNGLIKLLAKLNKSHKGYATDLYTLLKGTNYPETILVEFIADKPVQFIDGVVSGSLIDSIIEEITAMLNDPIAPFEKPWDIPILSFFLEEEISMFQVATYIMAIPFTLMYELKNGHAPFDDHNCQVSLLSSSPYSTSSNLLEAEMVTTDKKISECLSATSNLLSILPSINHLLGISREVGGEGAGIKLPPVFGALFSASRFLDFVVKTVEFSAGPKTAAQIDLMAILYIRGAFGLGMATLVLDGKFSGNNAALQGFIDVGLGITRLAVCIVSEIEHDNWVKASDYVECGALISEFIGVGGGLPEPFGALVDVVGAAVIQDALIAAAVLRMTDH
ncbi:MAG: hypothetical protein ACPGJS_10725 [Flammeovirgaceae bacterium]